MTSETPRSLRDALLAGRHTRPEVEGFAPALGAFLSEDEGALARWFGPSLPPAVRGDPRRLFGLVERDLVAIDQLLSDQVDAILHHPRLRRLEGSWRGLAWLVGQFEPTQVMKVKVFPANWRELDRDLLRTSEFDQSWCFKLVYEGEFGHAGGEPFGLLVVDHEVRHRPEARTLDGGAPVDDVAVIKALSSIAAAAFVPVVLAASPALLGADQFTDLVLAQNVGAPMGGVDHARWRAMAAGEDARFLCLTAPRILARPRWTRAEGSLWYDEQCPTLEQRAWFVAGYAFAAVVGRAQVDHNWPADVRGVEVDRIGGGLVVDLPAENFVFGAATSWPRSSLDLSLTDRQERELVLAGFMPLNALPHGDAAFASAHSLQARPSPAPGRSLDVPSINRNLSAQINNILCVSRFAHYVKTIGRDLTGSLTDAEAIERRLQHWLMNYTDTSAGSTGESRARYPLVSSAVHVSEIPGRPGSFGCTIHLQPCHQIDDIATTFRLVTNLDGALARV